jgi:hypothetical protein
LFGNELFDSSSCTEEKTTLYDSWNLRQLTLKLGAHGQNAGNKNEEREREESQDFTPNAIKHSLSLRLKRLARGHAPQHNKQSNGLKD